MGYRGVVDIDDELENHPDLEELALKREPFVQQLADDFVSFYQAKYEIKLLSIADIAQKISYAYFTMCYRHIKPVIEDKTNRFKMAALMELIIVKEQVLIHPTGNIAENREVNALFGMTAALSLINCMIGDATQEFLFDTANAGLNDRGQGILNDHKLWLETKPLNDMPIFINAQFYELIEVLHGLPIQLNGY